MEMSEQELKQAVEHDEANKAAQAGSPDAGKKAVLSVKELVEYCDKQTAILAKQLSLDLLGTAARIAAVAHENVQSRNVGGVDKIAASAGAFIRLAEQLDIIGDKAYVRAYGVSSGEGGGAK
jgi:hypothetical protein